MSKIDQYIGMDVVESPLLPDRQMIVFPDHGLLLVPKRYAPVLAARIEAVNIVREGLEDVLEWLDATSCPYYIASTGGPKDLPGKYGPGTCKGGCTDEPRCRT